MIFFTQKFNLKIQKNIYNIIKYKRGGAVMWINDFYFNNEIFLSMLVGPNNAIAASFIIMMGMAIMMIIDKYKSDEE